MCVCEFQRGSLQVKNHVRNHEIAIRICFHLTTKLSAKKSVYISYK